jgi:AraC-like DNA-binding protein
MLTQLHEELAAIGRIKYVHNICIYYRDWQYTVSSDLGIASLGFNPDALFLQSLDNMDFHYRNMIFRNRPLRNGETVPVLTMVRSIPVYYPAEFPDAWVVIDIDLSSLNGMMEDMFRVTDSFFSITSAQGAPLISIGNSAIGELFNYGDIDFPAVVSPNEVMRIGHDKYLILYAQSTEREWSFVYVEPYTSLGKGWFDRFFISALWVTALVLLMGILGSLFFSRRIYNPIRAIFEKTNMVKANDQKLKETDLILRKIDELIQDNNQLAASDALPYPVLIENEMYQAFRDGDWDRFEIAAAWFRVYYTGPQEKMGTIRGAYLRLLCASGIFSSGNFVLQDDEGPDYRQIFTLSSTGAINDWMLEWFSRAFNYLHADKRTESRLLKDICRYIDTHLGDDITAKGLWRHFNYHPSALRKLFREELHLTLKNYVDSKRLEKARELLTSTNLKVQEIALQVGYVNAQSFIAFFHQAVHCTPVEYRKRNS